MPRHTLLDDWMLGRQDVSVVLQARGHRNRLYAGASLCSLRMTGAFADWATVPIEALHHLARQLGLPPLVGQTGQVEPRTAQGIRRRIRDYLRFRPFDAATEEWLDQQLEARMEVEADPMALRSHAHALLAERRIVRPADTTLERVQGRVVQRVTERMCETALAHALPDEQDRLDDLLSPPQGGTGRSVLGRLKQVRSGKPATAFQEALELHDLLGPIAGWTTAAVHLAEPWRRRFAELAVQTDAATLRRHRRPVRVAAVSCFVALEFRRLLDELVKLYDNLVSGVCARATTAARSEVRSTQLAALEHYEVAGLALSKMLDDDDANTARDELRQALGEPVLRAAAAALLDSPHTVGEAFVRQLKRRYGRLRRFLPGFFALPLQAETGSEDLLAAVELVRQLDADSGRLPHDAPIDFFRNAFRRHLVQQGITRAMWESALAVEVRDALRRGDLFLPGAHHHASLTTTLHDDDSWVQAGPAAIESLGLTDNPLDVLNPLDHRIEEAATTLAKGLADNPVARVQAQALHVGRDKRRRQAVRARVLRRALSASLRHIRIEELLVEVDAITGFTDALVPLDPTLATPRVEARLAALLAHGTNLGVRAMAQSLEGVELQELERASRRCLSVPAITAANHRLVEAILRYTFDPDDGAKVRTSSDAQRFPTTRQSRVAGHFPPRHGFHQRSLKLYGHQVRGAMLSTEVIACTESEALYVLDALLDPESPVEPQVHHTDTHGATLMLFGISHLLGIELQPWLARPATRQLFAATGRRGPEPIASLFTGDADRPLVTEQWDRMLRAVVALAQRRAVASVLVRRLTGSRLGQAFVELGRLVRTDYLLRWLHEEPMRRSIRHTLNLMESRHKLSRDLFFGGHGRFSGHTLRSISTRASSLALLSNCVVAWNAVQLHRAVEELRTAGQHVPDDVLIGLSPLGSAHVQTRGIYRFKNARGAIA